MITQTTRQALQTHFSNLALTFYRYDQIRFIDLKGHERIRVNYKNNATYIVKEEDLQNKSRSKYFREGIKLAPGKVYVSPMELNIEYNKIEIPYKPVVRFVTPVVDDKGNKIGSDCFKLFSHRTITEFSGAHGIKNTRARNVNRPTRLLDE